MIVRVHREVLDDADWEDSKLFLEFVGAEIVVYDGASGCRVIEPYSPDFRTLKSTIENIKIDYPHSKIQEYNRYKDSLRVDNACQIVYTESDTDECFT